MAVATSHIRQHLVVVLVACGVCAQAQAREVDGSPFVLEVGGGWQGPIGYGGLALVYDLGGVLSAGLGVGVDGEIAKSFPPMGVFGRARALTRGPFSLGLAATLSRGHYTSARTYDHPPYTPAVMQWSWEPGYRLTSAVAAELAGRRWWLRVDGGVGYLLNQPRCEYMTSIDYYNGSCDSPSIPAPYHFSTQPGRVLPMVTAAVGYRIGVVDGGADGSPVIEGYRSPGTALLIPLVSSLGSLALGGGLLYASQGHSGSAQNGGIAALAVGLTIAPATGHLYATEYGHALLTTTIRVAAGALAIWAYVDSIPKDCSPGQCSNGLGGAGVVLALFSALVVPVTAVYDIADAPRAASRANEAHGHGLGLAPFVTRGGPAPARGIALGGRY
jgi:hypothetical protein